jgi:hypothetical protein
MPALTLDSLGTSSPTGHDTYLKLLRYNLNQLEIAASRARPTTATTQYLAETVDPSQYKPPPVPKPVEEEVPIPSSGVTPDSSGIKVQPIPNPLAGVGQPSTAPAPRPGRPNVLPPPSALPQPGSSGPSGASGPSGIRVAPMPPRSPGRESPTSRPRPSTLPSLDNPFGR